MLQEVEPATRFHAPDDGTPVATDNAKTTVQEDRDDDVEAAVSTSFVTFQHLVPLPHKERPVNAKKRRVGHAECLTSSPYKRKLEEMMRSSLTSRPGRQKKPPRKGSDAPATKKTKQRKGAKRNAANDDEAVVDNTPCLFCQIPYNQSRVAWWQCHQCSRWACAKCACVGKEKSFVCGICV